MRIKSKYKLFSKQVLDTIPSRILKFKRSKWQKTKAVAKKKVLRLKPKKNFGIFVSAKTLPKVKNYFKDCLNTSKMFRQFFTGNRCILPTNRQLSEFDVFFGQSLLKPFFKTEVLLYKLNLFNSVDEATQVLATGKILVNFQKKKPNYILKRGDIISIDDNITNVFFFTKNLLEKKKFLKKSLITFIEIDMITKTIIVVKNLTELNESDINLLIPVFLNVQHLKDFN